VRELMNVRYSPQESRLSAVECDAHDLSLRSLHFTEIRFLLSLVSTPEPQHGYFISKSWLANAKKHWESQLTDRSKVCPAHYAMPLWSWGRHTHPSL
jgi:hypothetical protein